MKLKHQYLKLSIKHLHKQMKPLMQCCWYLALVFQAVIIGFGTGVGEGGEDPLNSGHLSTHQHVLSAQLIYPVNLYRSMLSGQSIQVNAIW